MNQAPPDFGLPTTGAGLAAGNCSTLLISCAAFFVASASTFSLNLCVVLVAIPEPRNSSAHFSEANCACMPFRNNLLTLRRSHTSNGKVSIKLENNFFVVLHSQRPICVFQRLLYMQTPTFLASSSKQRAFRSVVDICFRCSAFNFPVFYKLRANRDHLLFFMLIASKASVFG